MPVARSLEKLDPGSQSDRSSSAPTALLIMVALLVVSFGVVFLGVLSYVFGH
jgi:hypothetical protein